MSKAMSATDSEKIERAVALGGIPTVAARAQEGSGLRRTEDVGCDGYI